MTKIIEKIWYGDLDPIVALNRENLELCRIEAEIYSNIESLNNILDAEQQQHLNKIHETISDYLRISNKCSFCDGFCLGTKLTGEAFGAAEKFIKP